MTAEGAMRRATAQDAAGVQAIYAPVVRDTVISFELEPPSVAEIERRIDTITREFPWLVWEHDGMVAGYAYASRHMDRAAYQWSVNVSAYVHADHRGRGIGKQLYTHLIELLRERGFYNAYAGITLPNDASVALHESVGFAPFALYREVGFKMGAWHDVGWWRLRLAPLPDTPAPPRLGP